MPKSLLWWLLSLSLLVLAGCGVSQPDITPPVETPESWDVVSFSWSEDIDDTITYTNKQYGFSFQLPGDRKDYKIFSDINDDTTIDIVLPTIYPWPSDHSGWSDDHTQHIQYAPMMSIITISHDEYEIYKCNEGAVWADCIVLSRILWHDDDYYYTLWIPNEYPKDLAEVAHWTAWWWSGYIDLIRSSFHVL